MSDLTIEIEAIKIQPGLALVTLSGPIDAKSVVTLKTELNSAHDRGLGCLILDLEKVTYVNSTGMGLLITLSDATEGEGLALVKVAPKVRIILDMMNIGSLFRMFQSREEALGWVKPRVAISTAEAPLHESPRAAVGQTPPDMTSVSSSPASAFASMAEAPRTETIAAPVAPIVDAQISSISATCPDAQSVSQWSIHRVAAWAVVAATLALVAWVLAGSWGR